MNQVFPPTTERPRNVGYCTNVHAGVDLPAIEANLDHYAVAVRERLGTDRLGVGLWIPDQASRDLIAAGPSAFADFLDQRKLDAFTINGFPFANFHGEHVKQRVYLPTWADTERLEYTQRLAEILVHLLPDQQSVGSISTLPIGWPDNPFTQSSADPAAAGENLRALAGFLGRLEDRTGKHIVVAIEPEPGCQLDTVTDMIEFFDRELPEASHRRFITVCHDICHSVVMNEPQRDVIRRYAEAGVAIGKVQVSSAIIADWEAIDAANREEALRQLAGFAEDRYLHQTGVLRTDGSFSLAEDLPPLLQETTADSLGDVTRWMIHFHVPIFLERFGQLGTSRDAVLDCLAALSDESIAVDFSGHLEVETYAWTVLPESMRQRGLAEDIASEIAWLDEQLAS